MIGSLIVAVLIVVVTISMVTARLGAGGGSDSSEEDGRGRGRGGSDTREPAQNHFASLNGADRLFRVSRTKQLYSPTIRTKPGVENLRTLS
ncbi:MAG: hypothetical protein ACR2MC_07095 [Actinomycetota bacterium]